MNEGISIIENALKRVTSGDLAEAPFPLTGVEAKCWLSGAASAYQHALEMIGEQSPAVAVPEQSNKDLIFEIMEIPISYGSADGVKYVYPSREEAIAIIKALQASAPPRITEQDMLVITQYAIGFMNGTMKDAMYYAEKFVDTDEGRNLLNKLNKEKV